MTLELTTEQEAIILQIAEQDGKSPAAVLIETAMWLHGMVEDEQEQRILDERIAEADRGVEWMTHEEVGRRLRSMLEHR